MKKVLDILLIVLLTILVINLFGNDDQVKVNNTLIFEFEDNDYTIPASIWVVIKNNTSTGIIFNTCDDLNIKYAWERLVFTWSFCKDVVLESLSGTTIDYSSEFNQFESIWNYNLSVNYDWKEYYDQFELENSWSFKKIFVGLFYAPMYNLMIFLLNLFEWVFWWAIIFITIIIRLILLFPQHKMMLSQKKLQAVQPKIKEIQEKYKWQQQVLWMKLMELYKKEKVNPMGSCWFLIIQMPILLVVYNIILSIKDPSNFFYTYTFLANFDLNSINYNFYWLDLLGSWWISWILLWLTVALIQFFQIKLSLANKSKISLL